MESLLRAIRERAEGRFDIELSAVRGEESEASRMLAFAPSGLTNVAVVRLTRATRDATARTLLCAELLPIDFAAAARWAADVREALREPEPADLYLLLIGEFSENETLRVEADESFCRKFVGGDPSDLLDGTFLHAEPDTVRVHGVARDPLDDALEAVAATRTWLTSETVTAWRKLLLSGSTGQDTAARLVAERERQ